MRVILSFLLFLCFLFAHAGNEFILSLDYQILVNEKYNLFVSINYDFSGYPEFIDSTVVSKSLKGVPLKYHISSITTSRYSNDIYPRLIFHKVNFLQGDLEVKQNTFFDKSKGIEVYSSFKKEGKFFTTNFSINYIECFDIPGLLFFISINGLSNVKSFCLFYSQSFTNIYLTNLSEFNKFGDLSDEFVRFKNVGGLTLVDRFKFSNVSIGIFTNAYVEGKLVDLKIIDRSELKNN
ncbi:MAG: hypothetical protein ACK4F9_01585 [Brevinematia bacterium]